MVSIFRWSVLALQKNKYVDNRDSKILALLRMITGQKSLIFHYILLSYIIYWTTIFGDGLIWSVLLDFSRNEIDVDVSILGSLCLNASDGLDFKNNYYFF